MNLDNYFEIYLKLIVRVRKIVPINNINIKKWYWFKKKQYVSNFAVNQHNQPDWHKEVCRWCQNICLSYQWLEIRTSDF